MIAILDLGSNLGDKYKNLETAISSIANIESIQLIKTSSIIQTPAWGMKDQADFLNCALLIETSLSAQELLSQLLDIESKIGRIRTLKWGPRLIDIDIIFFGSEIINEDNLKIPHPFLEERMFVLSSLMEICPDLIHPISGLSVKEIFIKLNRG